MTHQHVVVHGIPDSHIMWQRPTRREYTVSVIYAGDNDEGVILQKLKPMHDS